MSSFVNLLFPLLVILITTLYTQAHPSAVTSAPLLHFPSRHLLSISTTNIVSNDPGVFESLPMSHLLSSHAHVFATVMCVDDMEAGVTVLHESILQQGHRQPLIVLCSPNVSSVVRSRLARLPLVHILRAHGGHHAFCRSIPSEKKQHDCAHLKLLLWNLPHVSKLIFLEHDTVVLRPLADLAIAPPFSAVREPQVGLVDTGVMVIEPDVAVFTILQQTFCNMSTPSDATARDVDAASDHVAIRTAVPDAAWSDLSDTFNVPQDHMDALWYRRVATEPHVLHFKGDAKPWNWWRVRDGSPMSADAFNRWCRVARTTSFACGGSVRAEMIPPMQPVGSSDKNRFTVLLSTFRRPTWKDLTRHYTSFKSVSQVILLWHDPHIDPPLAAQLGLKVVVWHPGTDSLNNRFFAPGNVSEAVYICDDDVKVTETQLFRAFQIWRGHTRRLVGFFPRRWMIDSPYYSTRVRDGYNVVLTKGLFTHRYFLFLYSQLLPKRVKDVVDKYNNCEDILFNMMVSGYNGAAPLHVLTEGTIIDLGHGGGISARGSHFTTRFKCVRELIRVLGLTEAPLMSGSYSERPLKNKERE